VTHLFDEPIDPNLTFNETKLELLTEPKSKPMKRMSAIKAEEFLKTEYFTEYIRKSTVRASLKEVDVLTPSSKENLSPFGLSRTDGFLYRRVNTSKLTVTRIVSDK
jgi:hypothetical protein